VEFKEQVDDLRIAPSALGLFFHRAERVLDGEYALIRPGAGKRIVNVGDLKDAREERDVAAAQAIGISGTVPAFMVMADDR
jgi:hypothetical protein